MTVPLIQQVRVGAYVLKQRLMGVRRYPLVLMLEPLFRCNLACTGCGKIDYPKHILDRRRRERSAEELDAIVAGIVERRKFVYLCTNGLLLERNLDRFTPSPYLTFSVHLDGLEEEHDHAVDQPGTFRRAVAAIKAARARGFRANINCTLFDGMDPERIAAFFDFCTDELDVEGITIAAGYAYERAPDQEHFLNRQRTKELFRTVFRLGKGRKWDFNQSTMFLDFLAGNQTYRCTPWGNPARNVFGWQRPCYLIGEGYAGSFKELMEETDWDAYGTGNYEKCANCMVHSGYEPTAVENTISHPLKAARVALFGVDTEKPMAPEIPLENQRPAEYVFEGLTRALDTPGDTRDSNVA